MVPYHDGIVLMQQFNTQVMVCREVSCDYYELSFGWKGPIPWAGQFITLRCWEGEIPLLRRPFALSSYDVKERKGTVIFQKRGRATRIMTQLKPGDHLDIMGPLGGQFPLPTPNHRPVIVGGGIGTGPILFLASQLSASGLRPMLILGFRDKRYVPRVHLPVGCETVICTDDGSAGFHGNVIEYLKTRKRDLKRAHFYGCGPQPMLRGLHFLALDNDVPCSVSVEEVMACGIGACQGCAIPVTTEEKFLRVCKEGPVFDSRILLWT
jgi:dihydroorotate dehydrogenase electron transfer subunit